MSLEFSFSKILRILLIIFGDETHFSHQHFRYIEALTPKVFYIFGKGFLPYFMMDQLRKHSEVNIVML